MPSFEILDSYFNSTQERQRDGPIYLQDLHRGQEENSGESCRL